MQYPDVTFSSNHNKVVRHTDLTIKKAINMEKNNHMISRNTCIEHLEIRRILNEKTKILANKLTNEINNPNTEFELLSSYAYKQKLKQVACSPKVAILDIRELIPFNSREMKLT